EVAWTNDSRQIAFVRQPGRGGTPASPLAQRPQPWSILVAEPHADSTSTGGADDSAVESWKSGRGLVDSLVRGASLRWADNDAVVFMSYQDGWPHLYSIQHPRQGAKPRLLTPGAFMVEHVSLTADGR